jgi:D-beta-D-heptose 7-phosphate kinase/D-beta-D-heptose 1-phosphate adenosyltransferase
VKSLKGEKRPFNSQNERKIILESLKFVDEVHIFDEETPLTLISQVMPDVIVKGGDYKPEDVVGKVFAEVIIFETIDGYSTTKKIEDFTSR